MGKSLSVMTICQDEEHVIRWYLESCVHLAATYNDLKEIVIVDGGSKDNTIDVINSYKDKAPIKLLERSWDFTRAQMNYGLDQCSGDYVMVPDADMTWTTNLGQWLETGEVASSKYWDFTLLFTARDAYHCFKWPVGPSMRMFAGHLRYDETRKYHVHLAGQYSGIPACASVFFFENSCRIKNDEALLHRGVRRQACELDMAAEGASPGPPDRFLLASKSADVLVTQLPPAICSLILPSTNG